MPASVSRSETRVVDREKEDGYAQLIPASEPAATSNTQTFKEGGKEFAFSLTSTQSLR